MPLVEIIVPPSSSPPTNVPAFLAKLWKMVENPDTDDYISWTGDGNSFRIRDPGQFASSLLPYYYKHSNMASFVRQLNMYGFHKVLALHSGNLKSEKEEIEFAHTYFLRGQEHLLDQIKRKSASSSNKSPVTQPSYVSRTTKPENVIITKIEAPEKEEMVTDFLVEMSQMKERQDDLDNKLENMKSENEALWGEVLTLRQKHNQQQKIVNKLIQFLVALVQPRINKGIKRKFRHPSFQSPKLAIGTEEKDNIDASDDMGNEAKVQEISEDDCHLSDILSDDNDAQNTQTSPSKSKYTMVDPESVSPTFNQIRKEKRISTELSPSKLLNTSLDQEVDNECMQRELDSLKDILSGQITLDTSFMTGILTDNNSSDLISGMKMFTDSLLTPPDEYQRSQSSSDSDTTGHTGHMTDTKFLTYDNDNNMNSSILALAAQSSGIINFEQELSLTPGHDDFGMEIDF